MCEVENTVLSLVCDMELYTNAAMLKISILLK